MRCGSILKWGFAVTLASLPAWGGTSFGISDIERLVCDSSRHIDSVEKLLPLIPEEIRSNYVVVFQSQSVQQAAYDDANGSIRPRVILRSRDGKFLMGFNDAAMTGGERLEITQFDDAKAKFIYHEVNFSEPPGERVHRDDPQHSCRNCHREDPRPNWASYSNFHNTFGSDGDKPGDPEEQRKLASFLNTASAHPRYKYLIGLAAGYALGSDGTTRVRHNAEMTQALQELNAKRVVRLMRETADYNAIRFSALGAIACGPERGFDFRKFFVPGSPASQVRFTSFAGKDYGQGEHPLLYLFESRGIPTFHWTMNFEEPNHGPFRAANPIEASFVRALADSDPVIAEWIRQTPPGLEDPSLLDCEALARKARAQVAILGPTSPFCQVASGAPHFPASSRAVLGITREISSERLRPTQ